MFSPRVLDRANTLEFRVDSTQMKAALLNHTSIDLSVIIGRGAGYLSDFVRYANQPLPIADSDRMVLAAEAILLFDILEEYGHEFGFRVAQEIARFVGALRACLRRGWIGSMRG
jgi:hypothetical protein